MALWTLSRTTARKELTHNRSVSPPKELLSSLMSYKLMGSGLDHRQAALHVVFMRPSHARYLFIAIKKRTFCQKLFIYLCKVDFQPYCCNGIL